MTCCGDGKYSPQPHRPLRREFELDEPVGEQGLALATAVDLDLRLGAGPGHAETVGERHLADARDAEQQLARTREQQKAEFDKRSTQVETMVAPLKESLAKVDEHVRQLEQRRADAYSGLTEQVRSMAETQAELTKETGALVSALRRPQTRGQWGELQLRRAVEIAPDNVDYSLSLALAEAQLALVRARPRPEEVAVEPEQLCAGHEEDPPAHPPAGHLVGAVGVRQDRPDRRPVRVHVR